VHGTSRSSGKEPGAQNGNIARTAGFALNEGLGDLERFSPPSSQLRQGEGIACHIPSRPFISLIEKDLGITCVLLKRFDTDGLPATLSIKKKVAAGEILSHGDIEYLRRLLCEAKANLGPIERLEDFRKPRPRGVFYLRTDHRARSRERGTPALAGGTAVGQIYLYDNPLLRTPVAAVKRSFSSVAVVPPGTGS
jgi:hypothetical protein